MVTSVANARCYQGYDTLQYSDVLDKFTAVRSIIQMINGCWKACYEPDDVSGRIFAADAIISNPPAFAHVHCAEALGIPILLSFSES